MSAIWAASAASRLSLEGPQWAVLFGVGTPLLRKCCQRSNGGKEPRAPDAAVPTNGGLSAF